MSQAPIVGIIMGSDSDGELVAHAERTLSLLSIPYETGVYSAHRTPDRTADYAKSAASRGLKVIIAAAGGAAHLAGVVSALTPLPVLGIPIQSKLNGLDSLLSTVQMPAGVPTATFSIGSSGAINAALFAARILALTDPAIAAELAAHTARQEEEVLAAHRRVSERARIV